MEIKPPSADLYTAITRSVTSTTQSPPSSSPPANWKVEQLIQAVITKITDKQLFLDIQGVKANTPKPTLLDLKVGDILKLQIEQLKPLPQFRIISLQKNSNVHLVTQALKNAMAQNAELAPLLKNISFVANRPALRPSPLAADINAAVRDIFKQIPSPFNLKTATQIKTQLENNGVFLENKIKQQITSVLQNTVTKNPEIIQSKLNSNIKSILESDLAAQLHRLASAIKTQLVFTQKTPSTQNETNTLKNLTTPPAQTNIKSSTIEQASLQYISQREEAMHIFLRQIESGLTHLQQHQLQNLNDAQSTRPMWLMELPIKDGQHIDLFELRISEEENTETQEQDKKIWNVTLQFDLAGLGKIKAHVKMHNDAISAQFFSEKPETLSLFRENFDFLRSRLNINGMDVGNIECAHAQLSNIQQKNYSKPLDEQT